MTDDLDTWGRAQLDEDERAAIETGASDHPAWRVVVTDGPSSPTPMQAVHIERHGPWRVLRRVAADRRILDLHGPLVLTYWPYPMCMRCKDPQAESVRHPLGSPSLWRPGEQWPCETVRLLFLPYADRDGYRSEWKP